LGLTLKIMCPRSTKGNHPIFKQGMKAESAALRHGCAFLPNKASWASSVLVVFLAAGCAERQPQWIPAGPPAAEREARAEPIDGGEAPAEAAEKSTPADRPPASPRVEVLTLPVEGFGPAVVVAPLDDTPRPMLIAAHGAGDSPEWQCEHWGPVADARFYVLCPRGLPLGRGDDSAFYYADHLALEREVVAMVRAARAAFGARLATKGGVYTGYSQGATMGALMVVDHGADFQHLVLVEGGSGEWTLGRARRFQATGGESVAIVCGTPGCASRGKRSQALLEKAGLRARLEHVEGGGHTYVGSVGDRARELLNGWTLGP
jgi:predicted esterase